MQHEHIQKIRVTLNNDISSSYALAHRNIKNTVNTLTQQQRQETFVFHQYPLRLLLWRIGKTQLVAQKSHKDTAQGHFFAL